MIQISLKNIAVDVVRTTWDIEGTLVSTMRLKILLLTLLSFPLIPPFSHA